MKKKVLWKYWKDPFDLDTNKHLISNNEDEDDVFLNEYKHTFDDSGTHPITTKMPPCIAGPMGLIPLTEYSMASKVYNFWMLHTNFNITEPVKQIILKIDGVETLDVFTRYRARIGIGSAFDPGQVKNSIEETICKEEAVVSPAEVQTKIPVDLLKAHLKQKYKYWVIFTNDNGSLNTFGADNQQQVEEKVKNYNAKTISVSWK